MSREEIIAVIKKCARKLKRPPTHRELKKMAGISHHTLQRVFRGITLALREAGLKPSGPGHLHTAEELLMDWAAAARKLRKVPPMMTYRRMGRYSHVPFTVRFGSWHAVPGAFQRFARERGIEREWKDVLAMIPAQRRALRKRIEAMACEKERKGVAQTGRKLVEQSSSANNVSRELRYARRGFMKGRPVAGPPLNLDALAHAPANEMGVVFLFGALAKDLGFRVLTFQAAYPDCVAMREVEPGRWQWVNIEFEHESRNFLKHGHSRRGCDVIVCWRHNWKECPKNIEVVELRKVVGRG